MKIWSSDSSRLFGGRISRRVEITSFGLVFQTCGIFLSIRMVLLCFLASITRTCAVKALLFCKFAEIRCVQSLFG